MAKKKNKPIPSKKLTSLKGILKSKNRSPVSLKEMKNAIHQHAKEKDSQV